MTRARRPALPRTPARPKAPPDLVGLSHVHPQVLDLLRELAALHSALQATLACRRERLCRVCRSRMAAALDGGTRGGRDAE